MVVPVKGKVMVPVVVAPVIKALVARVLVVARPPQTQPPQKTVTGTQTLETQPVLMTVGKSAPNSHSQGRSLSPAPNSPRSSPATRSSPAISNRHKLVLAPVAAVELAVVAVELVAVAAVTHPRPRPQPPRSVWTQALCTP